ncbi:hypothetical protein FKP32DRAFT_1600844 [Trametes sanguinea]|nr:hypothetical protein FKP32DRAFT_1600844 [Trametes sanguinea]
MSTETETIGASTGVSPAGLTLLMSTTLKDDEEAAAVSEQLAAALQSKMVDEEVMNSIRNLSKDVKEINTMFTKIGQGFVEFDSANFLDLQGNVLKLGDKWGAFHQRFQVLIDASFDNASAASAFMAQFANVLLTDVPANARQDLRDELRNFVNQLKPKADDALKFKGGFTNLATDLRTFTAVLEETLKRADSRVAADLQQMRQKIESLKVQLQEVTEKIHKMSQECLDFLAAGASSVGGVLGKLAPKAIWSAFMEVFTHEQEKKREERERQEQNVRQHLETAKQQESSLISELDKVQVSLAELMAKEQLLAKYMSSLEGTKKNIEGLAGKIDAIAQIWQCLRVDMVSLDTQLELAVDPEARLTYLFMRKIQLTRALYLKTASMLELYAKGRVPVA